MKEPSSVDSKSEVITAFEYVAASDEGSTFRSKLRSRYDTWKRGTPIIFFLDLATSLLKVLLLVVDIPLAFSSLYAPLLVTALFIMKVCIPISFIVMHQGQGKKDKEEDEDDKEGGNSSEGGSDRSGSNLAFSTLSMRDRRAVDIRITELKYINS